MNTDRYFYSFSNASITLRVLDYLRQQKIPLKSVAVINLIDRWIVQVSLKYSPSLKVAKNIRAFFSEMGIMDTPSVKIKLALEQLEAGVSPTEVMNRHQIVIVAFGEPEQKEVEIFRQQIVEKLGYCPQNMA